MLMLSLFVAGAIAGWLTKRAPAPVDDAPADSHTPLVATTWIPTDAVAAPKPTLAQGDRHFRAERHDLALEIYHQLLPGAEKPVPAYLAVRIALCQEELGKWEDAIKSYREVIGPSAIVESRIAHLSLARLHLRRFAPVEARALLWPFLLRGGHGNENALMAECAYLLALALGMDAQPPEAADDSVPALVLPRIFPWRTERYLTWLNGFPKRDEKRPEQIVLEPAKNKQDQVVADALVPKSSLVKVIELLAHTSGIAVEWGPGAKDSAAEKTASLNGGKLSVLALMMGMADSVDLRCDMDKEALRFSIGDDQSGKATSRYRQGLARRVLSDVVTHFPIHPLKSSALLLLGNLEGTGRPTEALTWYDQIASTVPYRHEILYARCNRGLLLHRQGKNEAAAKAYLSVVDLEPGHLLAGLAMLRLGEMALEERDYPKAITYLKRAEANAIDHRQHPPLFSLLAIAYAFHDQADQVRTLLAKHRECFLDKRYRTFTHFLDAYAAFRQASLATRPAAESNHLMTALLALPKDIPLGNLGRHIVGLAYCDLGIWDHAKTIYEGIVADAKGPLLEESSLRLADATKALGDRKQARVIYAALAEKRSLPAAWARFHLAAMELEDDHPNVCIDLCRRMLDESHPLDRSRLLFMMGQSYERIRDFGKASQCYAGEIPR